MNAGSKKQENMADQAWEKAFPPLIQKVIMLPFSPKEEFVLERALVMTKQYS